MGLDSVDILVKIEETFAITIPGYEAEQIITVNDLHNTAWKHLSNRYNNKSSSQSLSTKSNINREEMESVINRIIAGIAGLDPEKVTPEKKICDDLGID